MKGLADLSDAAYDQLYERTRGWAAGLVLMTESMRMGGAHEAVSCGRAPQEIFDYFAQEVFSKTDERTRVFLQKTALLPGMTASAAEELTGEPASREMLSRLFRNHYFTHRDAQPEPVYQYHPLFREFLLSHAEESMMPEEIAALRRRAAGLLQESGAVEDAVDMLLKTQDWASAATVIVAHAPVLLKQGRYALLREWLDSLPGEVAGSNPWLLFFSGMACHALCRIGERLFLRAGICPLSGRRRYPGVCHGGLRRHQRHCPPGRGFWRPGSLVFRPERPSAGNRLLPGRGDRGMGHHQHGRRPGAQGDPPP